MYNSTVSSSPQKKFHPKFFDLGHPFEKILRSWGSGQIQRVLSPLETTYAPLERMTILTGTLSGTLVVRSSLEFAVQLRNLRSDSSLGRYSEAEVFEEMISLYSLYLFHDFWIPQDFQVGPIHPFRSVPADWPLGQPHAVSNYLVDGFPVEIRLWMKD